MHITQVVFAICIISVRGKQLFSCFRGEFQEDSEEFKKGKNDFGMAVSTEFLNFLNVVLQDFGVLSWMEAVEFGNVVSFDVIEYSIYESG